MITFEEAVKELKISQDNLQSAQSESGFQTVSLPNAVDLISFLVKHPELGTTYREWKFLKDENGEQYGFIAAKFNDETTKKFYPLAEGVNVVARERARKYGGTIVEALKSAAPTQSNTGEELKARVSALDNIIGNDDNSLSYTDFGKGVRAAFEAIALYNDPEESAKYLDEIKAKSFKEIHRKINTDPDLCPLCGSKNISSTNEDWDHDEYYDDLECRDCGAEWTLTYKCVSKDAIANKDGTKIIPTNQEAKNESVD